MNEQRSEQLIDAIRAQLDDSISALEPSTSARLDEMRRQAMRRARLQESLNDSEENFVMAAQVALDDSIDELDSSLHNRLNESRKLALSALEKSETVDSKETKTITNLLASWLRFDLKPIKYGAFASACVLVAAISLLYSPPEQLDPEFADADALLFASNEDIDLYENLDFYLWLAENGIPN